MTEQEFNNIVEAVLSSVRTNSRTIEQLTPMSAIVDTDSIEITQGRRITVGLLKEAIAEALDIEDITSDIVSEIANAVIQQVAIDADASTATLSIKQAGFAAKTVSMPVASDSQAGIITAADKEMIDDTHEKAETLEEDLDEVDGRVSTLEGKVGTANGLAELDSTGHLKTEQIPTNLASGTDVSDALDEAKGYTDDAVAELEQSMADKSDVYTKEESDERYLVARSENLSVERDLENFAITYTPANLRGAVGPYGSNGAWHVKVFAVAEGDTIEIGRVGSSTNGALLCALYNCANSVYVAGSGTEYVVATGPKCGDLTDGTYRIASVPAGAKWLAVTMFSGDTISVRRITLENAGDVIGDLSGDVDALESRVSDDEAAMGELADDVDAIATRLTADEETIGNLSDGMGALATRVTGTETKNNEQDARLVTLERTGLFEDESPIAPDHTLAGYAIVNNGDPDNPKYSAYGSDLFTLLGYDVVEGDMVEIKVADNSARAGWSRVYAFYALTDLDDNGTPLISAATRVSAGEADRVWNGTAFDDVVTVPVGATMLVVTQVNTLTNKLEVKNRTPQGAASLFPRVAALEAIDAESLFPRVDALEGKTEDLEDTVEELADLLLVEQLVEVIPDDTFEHWFVASNPGTGYVKGDLVKWQTEGSHYFDAKVFATHEGEQWQVSNWQNGSTSSGGMLWAVYDGDTFAVPSDADVYDIHGRMLSCRSGSVPSGQTIVENVTIPAGGKWLVVTQRVSGQVQQTVSKVKYVSPSEATDELEEEVDDLKTRVTDVENADALRDTITKLSVFRSGEYICIACNMGNGYEYCFRLSRGNGWNGTMCWQLSGVRAVNRLHSVADDDIYRWRGITQFMNSGESDVIGPTGYEGYADFVGGAHRLNYVEGISATTPTAITDSWSVTADGVEVADGDSLTCREVTLTVVNLIRRPADGVVNANGKVTAEQEWSDLVPFSTETQVVTIKCDGTVTAHVQHAFAAESVGKTIKTYYGMQSRYLGDRVLTIGGAYKTPTPYTGVTPFKKSGHETFDRFIEIKDSTGWCQSTWLRPDVGIGDHRHVGSNDNIFQTESSGNKGKYYHRMVSGLEITDGLTYEWEGVYSWFRNSSAIMRDIELAAVQASGGGGGGGDMSNYYTKPSGGIPKTDLASAVQTSLGKADTAVQRRTVETSTLTADWAYDDYGMPFTAQDLEDALDTYYADWRDEANAVALCNALAGGNGMQGVELSKAAHSAFVYVGAEFDASGEFDGFHPENAVGNNPSLTPTNYAAFGLTDSLAPAIADVDYTEADEFLFSFICSTDNCSLTLPSGVSYGNGLDFDADKKSGRRFQFSICDGIALYAYVDPSNS